MRKGPGYIARIYGTGRKNFLEAAQGRHGFTLGRWRTQTPQPASKMCKFLLENMDFAAIEQRTLAQVDILDFAAAAGRTLAAVNADPRNHFGKYALRRFDK